MYWSVLGILIGVEYIASWVLAWIPFYSLIRLMFVLYIAMPQTQGGTYLYTKHIQPFFRLHEHEIDALLASFRTRAYGWFQGLSGRIWDAVMISLGQQRAPDLVAAATIAQAASMGMGAQPSMSDPASGPGSLAGSLWAAFGPSLVAGGAAFMKQSAQEDAPFGLNESARNVVADDDLEEEKPAKAPNAVPAIRVQTDSSFAVAERRRRLEAELAALERMNSGGPLSPGPLSAYPMSTVTSIGGPSATGLWSRSTSRDSADEAPNMIAGKIVPSEDAEVPSDIEDEKLNVRRPGAGRRPNWA
jgi:receptor expression-enhancing protein 1/2/3/4